MFQSNQASGRSMLDKPAPNLNTEVKLNQARTVLGWGTAQVLLVRLARVRMSMLLRGEWTVSPPGFFTGNWHVGVRLLAIQPISVGSKKWFTQMCSYNALRLTLWIVSFMKNLFVIFWLRYIYLPYKTRDIKTLLTSLQQI